MLSKEEIENMKIGLWNMRADNLKAMQCSLADTSYKKEWQKEINVIDNALEYINQLELDKQKIIEKLEGDEKIFGNYEERKQMAREQLYENDGKWFYCLEILSILKGE